MLLNISTYNFIVSTYESILTVRYQFSFIINYENEPFLKRHNLMECI